MKIRAKKIANDRPDMINYYKYEGGVPNTYEKVIFIIKKTIVFDT